MTSFKIFILTFSLSPKLHKHSKRKAQKHKQTNRTQPNNQSHGYVPGMNLKKDTKFMIDIYCLMFSAGKQRRSGGGRDLASLVIVAVEESASEPTSTTSPPPRARRTQT